jgi:hypothetical protein
MDSRLHPALHRSSASLHPLLLFRLFNARSPASPFCSSSLRCFMACLGPLSLLPMSMSTSLLDPLCMHSPSPPFRCSSRPVAISFAPPLHRCFNDAATAFPHACARVFHCRRFCCCCCSCIIYLPPIFSLIRAKLAMRSIFGCVPRSFELAQV